MIHWGWDHREQGDHSRFPGTDEGIGSQEQKESCESTFRPFVTLGGASLLVSRGSCWCWGLGQSNKLGREVGRRWFEGSTGDVGRGEERWISCSVVLGKRLGDLGLGEQRGEGLQAA